MILTFLEDLVIPFDNDQCRGDLRMLKVRQKIAQSFRVDMSVVAFVRIRS